MWSKHVSSCPGFIRVFPIQFICSTIFMMTVDHLVILYCTKALQVSPVSHLSHHFSHRLTFKMCHKDSRPTVTKGSAFELRPSSPTSISKQDVRLISWAELATHNKTTDAWIAIKGRVYDVTHFSKLHPGGDILFTAAGLDATDVFAAFHASTDAWRNLATLCVGVLDAPQSPLPGVDPAYVSDIVKMRKQVRSLHLFDSNKLFYAYKVASNVAICLTSVAIVMFSGTLPAIFLSGLLMALFWQQCGWLAHDFLHHQVFVDRRINNLFGILIGNIFQGFSVAWWKNKHNHHHAVPNVTEAPAGGDPDIATTPILFWSEKLIENDIAGLPRWMLRNQFALYGPILCFARISWLQQSLAYQTPMPNPNVTSFGLYVAELAGLAMHHILYISLVIKVAMMYSIPKAFFFNFVCQALGGVLLGVVFAVGHNAMDVFTLAELRNIDFVRLQVRTTRNVDPHWFTDWFTGGLNYQVEHHIFPSVPRHHLPKVAQIFRAFCAKYNIPYTSETLIEGNKAVCGVLQKVSKAA